MHQIELESLTFQNFIQSLWDKKVLLKKEKTNIAWSANRSANWVK